MMIMMAVADDENKFYSMMCGIPYREYKTNENVCQQANILTDVRRQASQVIMVRPCLPSLYAAENHHEQHVGVVSKVNVRPHL